MIDEFSYRSSRWTIARLVLPLLVVQLVAVCDVFADDSRPNIVLVLADDVGIEGLQCYGGVSYATPFLDAMAAEGLRFTDAFSQPLCTPTRVQLMTGRYNHRNWTSFGILDPSVKTIGHHMKAAGYATAIFGKWQLQSYDPPDFPGGRSRRGTGMAVEDAGFDEFAVFHARHTEDKGSRYANPTMAEGVAGDRGTVKTHVGDYGEDIWLDKVMDFLRRRRDRPAFVYYPMALPHNPFQPTPDSDEYDPTAPAVDEVRFTKGMIEYIDTLMGRLMRQLKSAGLADNTVVIFTSDNGTNVKVTSLMADGREIRGGKATPLQTGIHVPLIAWSPGHVKPRVTERLVDMSDMLPTCLALADWPVAEGPPLDGISFADQFRPAETPEETPAQRDAVFVWYDPRPGWDKERFGRHVFALDHTHKLFRNGRLVRLTDRPLEEIEVTSEAESNADRAARRRLAAVIAREMQPHPDQKRTEPPLVDAFGRPL
ncbi:MAG: sulfatase-like hydrolase/transferase [Planctomycetota bacterium]